MYAEIDHLFYSTTVFSFTDQPAFTAFVKGLTIIQQSNIRKIHIYVPSYFFKSRRNKISAGESMATDDVISIVSGIQKLERLQTLELWVDASNPAGDKYQAHGIYQLLKSIQVTHSVKVLLFDDLFSDTRWLSMEWPLGCRKEFANAVWRDLCHPGCIRRYDELLIVRGEDPGYALHFSGVR
jgi:hypothetical protein